MDNGNFREISEFYIVYDNYLMMPKKVMNSYHKFIR